MANADNKTIEAAIASPLTTMSTSTSYYRQRAVKGGRISDAIVDLEAEALRATLLGHSPAVLCCDIKAAFPSLIFIYLISVLTAMGVPPPILHAISVLYTSCIGYVLFKGQSYGSIHSRRGVRQGGTASSVLFILAYDPFLRYLASQLGPSSSVFGFADDTAVVMWNVYKQLMIVRAAFTILARAAGLHIHGRKNQLLHLFDLSLIHISEPTRPY